MGGNDGSAFYIDNSGRIYVDNNGLDFETQSSYLLEVRALYKDENGDFTLQATPNNTTVNITITDVNEPPYWNYTASPNIITFCYDPDFNESVGSVQALDPDTVASFVYSGDSVEPFFIDSAGHIRRRYTHLSSIADTSFNLTVFAKDPNNLDLQTPPHVISLHWCDFTTPNFLGDLTQNVTILEQSMDFEMHFPTAAKNVNYVIESGNKFNHFAISLSEGTLSINAPLDRENTSYYQLVISAQGLHGRGNYSDSNLTLNIEVSDINDNDPILEVTYTPTYHVGIYYSNVTVLNINASDPDKGENGTITYISWNITALPPQMKVIGDVLVINGTLSTALAGTNATLNVTVCDNGIDRRCNALDNIVFRKFFSQNVIQIGLV